MNDPLRVPGSKVSAESKDGRGGVGSLRERGKRGRERKTGEEREREKEREKKIPRRMKQSTTTGGLNKKQERSDAGFV